MTACELQTIASRLSNCSWCRHWLNFYDSADNVWMAIQCRDNRGKPEPVHDLESRGFSYDPDSLMYFIQRTNEDGSPFKSRLGTGQGPEHGPIRWRPR